MNQVPTKIVLKSTTRMSLNDRFSNIAPSTQAIRANVASEHQVSAANRRLAQQLAHRPGIPQNQVAGMYNRQPGRMRRGSLQQRLGQGNVKARLTLPSPQGQARGRGRGRGRANFQQGGQVRDNSQWSPNKSRGRGGLAFRAQRGQGNYRGQGRGQFNRSWTDNGLRADRGGNPRFRGPRRGSQPRGFYPDRLTGQPTYPRGRGARGGPGGRGQRRGGRGFRGGRGGRGAKPQTSVSELDNQLDAYMSKTKSALDSELDAYMATASA